MKYFRRILAVLLTLVVWSTGVSADRLDDAYNDLLNASLELSSTTVDILLERIDLIAQEAVLIKESRGERIDLEEAVQRQILNGTFIKDSMGFGAELLCVETMDEFCDKILEEFGLEVGRYILEYLLGNDYLTAAEGAYRLADWAVAAYEGLNAVSVNSSNMLLQKAEIIRDNLKEIYPFIENLVRKDIAANGFTEPEDRKAKIERITTLYRADVEQVYQKIKKELKDNRINLFRNPKERVALESMKDEFEVYLQIKPSYYGYYTSYFRSLLQRPKSLVVKHMVARYDEEASAIYVDASAESEIPWIRYRFGIYLNDELVYSEEKINDGCITYTCDQPGEYSVRMFAEDRWGQKVREYTTAVVPKKVKEEVIIHSVSAKPVEPETTIYPVISIPAQTQTLIEYAAGKSEYDDMEMLCGNAAAYRVGDLWGIILKDGTIASEPVYTSVNLCICGQGERDYGFEETIFAVRGSEWYILSPDTGEEAGIHGGHGGVTGLPMWNAATGVYTNAYGGNEYDRGISAAYDKESLDNGRRTFSLMSFSGEAVVSGASMVSVPTRGRSTIYAYCMNVSKYSVVVKDDKAYLVNQNSDMLCVGTDAKAYYDDIVPIRADDGWTYYSAWGERLVTAGYDDVTEVWKDGEKYYGWVKENGQWHMIPIEYPEGYMILHAVNEVLPTPDIPDKYKVYYTWDEMHSGMMITRVEIISRTEQEGSVHIIVLPSEVDGIDVVSIQANSCQNLHGFSEIVLPGTLKYVGDYAFYGNALLKGICLPKSTEYIGKGSFANCGLEEIQLFHTLTIDTGAFADTPIGKNNGEIIVRYSDVDYRNHRLFTLAEYCSQAVESIDKPKDYADSINILSKSEDE